MEPIRTALRTLAGIYRRAPAEPGALAQACAEVAQWADARGFHRTALWYAQARAELLPSLAAASLAVARAALDLRLFVQGETWLRRTCGVARGSGEWSAWVEAHLLLGDRALARDDLRYAALHYGRALRGARRYRFADLEAAARLGYACVGAPARNAARPSGGRGPRNGRSPKRAARTAAVGTKHEPGTTPSRGDLLHEAPAVPC